jgi:hypothetical protein
MARYAVSDQGRGERVSVLYRTSTMVCIWLSIPCLRQAAPHDFGTFKKLIVQMSQREDGPKRKWAKAQEELWVPLVA